MIEEKISVIVPIYKVEKEIVRCVESLLCQDYNDFEIILVDDGSPDKSGDIADTFANTYPEIVRVIHQENKGLSGARNTGIRKAVGNFISFIDSDDFVESNMLSTLYAELKRTKSDIAVCGRFDDYFNYSKINFTMKESVVLSNEETIRRILTWNQLDVSACDKLFKVELWKDISFPEGENNEDIQTIPAIISKAKKIVHVGLPLYHYCHRENSITTTYNEKKIKDFFKAIKYVEEFVQNNYPAIKDELVYYLNHTYLSLWMMCSQIRYQGAEKESAKQYLKSNWKNTFSLKRMTKRDKLAYLMIRFHIYYILKKIKVLFVQ